MRSIGVYYKSPVSEASPCENCKFNIDKDRTISFGDSNVSDEREIAEIHCNLWKIQQSDRSYLKSPKYSYYLDFGIKFSENVNSLSLYLPFETDVTNIIDLTEILSQNQELSSLVFNEDVQTTCSNGPFHSITINNETLFLYNIGETNLKKDSSKEIEKGSIISIDIHSKPNLPALNQNRNIYLRFRIHLNDKAIESFRRQELLSADIIQSIFSKLEMYDFRINDVREINKKVDEYLRFNHYRPFKMQKVHFFLMLDTRNALQQSSMKSESRFLETDKWQSYMATSCILPKNMIAYHWKDQKEKELEVDNTKIRGLFDSELSSVIRWKRQPFSNFRLFFMVTYPHRCLLQIGFYCLLAIILGSIGSLIGSLILNQNSLNSCWWVYSIVIPSIAVTTWIQLKRRSRVNFVK